VEETDLICEQLVATAIEATMIVVESKLHGDPIPSLRGHCRLIIENRERLYRSYSQSSRADVDTMLRQYGLRALCHEYRSDTRNHEEALCGTFIELLFHSAEPKPTKVTLDSKVVSANIVR
jgi:hypothetical protein